MISWRKCWAVTKKDIWVYYKKGPVLIFGVLFPFFLFLAFAVGRDIPPGRLAPGLIGMALSAIPVFISLTFLGASLASVPVLVAAVILSAFCFAVMGTLFSTPPTDDPASIMTLANLVRLPLIFFSGVFLPVRQMPEWGQVLSYFSPLTYTTEAMRFALGEQISIHPAAALAMIIVFLLAFWTLSLGLHKRNTAKRLWA